MKKLLTIMLSVVICVGVALTFTGCNDAVFNGKYTDLNKDQIADLQTKVAVSAWGKNDNTEGLYAKVYVKQQLKETDKDGKVTETKNEYNYNGKTYNDNGKTMTEVSINDKEEKKITAKDGAWEKEYIEVNGKMYHDGSWVYSDGKNIRRNETKMSKSNSESNSKMKMELSADSAWASIESKINNYSFGLNQAIALAIACGTDGAKVATDATVKGTLKIKITITNVAKFVEASGIDLGANAKISKVESMFVLKEVTGGYEIIAFNQELNVSGDNGNMVANILKKQTTNEKVSLNLNELNKYEKYAY